MEGAERPAEDRLCFGECKGIRTVGNQAAVDKVLVANRVRRKNGRRRGGRQRGVVK
jgi:hypothetical protein